MEPQTKNAVVGGLLTLGGVYLAYLGFRRPAMMTPTERLADNIFAVTGIATTLAGGFFLYRGLRKDAGEPQIQPGGVGPYPPPPVPPTPPVGPSDVGVPSQPTWDADIAADAAEIMAEEYAAMGEPSYSYARAVELAGIVAEALFPGWSWPQNLQQSNAFLQSDDPARPVWNNLVDLAQIQMGYRPVT